MAQPEVVPLELTITEDGRALSSVTLHPMRVAHYKAMAADTSEEPEKTSKLISMLTGLSPGAVDQLGIADFFKLSERVWGFFPEPVRALAVSLVSGESKLTSR